MEATATVKFKGVDFDVKYYWQNAEPRGYTLSNGDPGGTPEEFYILSVTHKEFDWSEVLEVHFEEIEQIVKEVIK